MLKRQPHSLYIIGLRTIFQMFDNSLSEHKKDLNLSNERYDAALDWIIMEILNQYLLHKKMRLSSHYHDDEGKTLYSLFPKVMFGAVFLILDERIKHFKSGKVTAMISGFDLIISKELL